MPKLGLKQGSTLEKTHRHHTPKKVIITTKNKPVGWDFRTDLLKSVPPPPLSDFPLLKTKQELDEKKEMFAPTVNQEI